MAGNVWAKAFEARAAREMEHDPVAAPFLVKMQRRLRANEEGDIADVIGQYGWRSSGWTYGQALAFAKIRAAIETGDVVAYSLPVKGEPGPDADWQTNRRVLRAGLATFPEFSVDVFEASPGNVFDGRVSWDETASFPLVDGDDRFLGVRHAVLEIGTTSASTTYSHLALGGSVVRWPYGSDMVTFLFATVNWGVGRMNEAPATTSEAR